MRFDLFDAMRDMEKELGPSGEMAIRIRPEGYVVTLRISDRSQCHTSGFLIPMVEIRDANVNVMNLKFKEALYSLKDMVG